MMKVVLKIVLCLWIVSNEVFAIGIVGSDGPTPFFRIPAPRKISIPLKGMISSFSVLEQTNKIAYVDPERVLRLYDLNNGEETQFGGFINQLFPISDPEGKIVLSSDLKNIKRVVGKSKGQDLRLPGSIQFLGWDQKDLYLLKKLERINNDSWKVSYLVYNQEKNQVHHRSCDFQPEDNPKILKFGDGHLFPNALLYSEKIDDGFTELNLYSLDLRVQNGRCQIQSQSDHPSRLKGSITSVNWVAGSADFVIITDHESSNLYFGKPEKFLTANLPAGLSYVPNPKSPLIININRQKGIGVYSLITGRFFTLELSVDRGFLEGNQVWVDSEAQQLYISTKEQRLKSDGRALHTVSLKGLN